MSPHVLLYSHFAASLFMNGNSSVFKRSETRRKKKRRNNRVAGFSTKNSMILSFSPPPVRRDRVRERCLMNVCCTKAIIARMKGSR